MPTPTNPYPVQVTANFDGDNNPYFLYADSQGINMRSPLLLPAAQPPYDGISFSQPAENRRELRLWAAVTHTLDGSSSKPQGGNLLLAVDGLVSIPVGPQVLRGTVLVFEQLNSDSVVVGLVPTPDPITKNEG